MSRYSVECVVLKKANYGDADRFYTLFAKNRGKLSALAKGVRKIASRRSGNLDTLNHVIIGISESGQGFKTITEAKVVESFKSIKTSLKSSVNAYYVIELVHKFFEDGEEDNRVFDLLLSTLHDLSRAKPNPILAVSKFEVQLMTLLGYKMTLDGCFVCGRMDVSNWSAPKFNVGVGGLICDTCSGGVAVEKDVACALAALRIGDANMSSKPAIAAASALVKQYVKSVLDKAINTERVYVAVDEAF